MIEQAEFDALVATYAKHGWVLRRVVLRDKINATVATDPDIEIGQSVIDAAWFSRPPHPGPIAWEIRYLGLTPYALVEHIDENSPDFEQTLHEVEVRLASGVTSKE